MLHSLLLISAVGCVLSVPLQVSVEEQKCGYKSCHETPAGVLNVHIVPHTHDDVGWLKTVDQYYYGSRNNIQKAGVQYIIDSVIKELWEDPKRRFIYVETAFFWKWWVRQTEDVQQKVHTLVKEGRLQFVGGAWSMNDEANVHYQTTIDQFTWGLSKLNETFGHCARPRVGWQIDPFGHSKEFASLISMMGYDGLFLGRIDYQDKIARKRDKRMEMVWRGDEALGKPSDIFTGVLYNTYSPPPGFCFDVLCNDEPIIDDPDSPMFNVDTKVTQFLEICRNMSLSYKSNNILITMGEDFNYQDAAMWFTNLDKLIEYSNLKAAKEGLNISMFYSTPTCYLKAVKEADPVLPTKTDDFFPYASDESAYWTGYFTSRPTTKFFEREGNNYLQMVKQLQVLAGLEKHNQFVINELKSAMGVMQHHDAITGTEKQHVTHDYERLLDQAIEDALIVARQAFNKLTQGDATKPPIFDYQRCRLNESSCQVSETSDQFVVTLYNPLAWPVTEVFRIPVVGENYEVHAPDGKIEIEVIPISQVVINIPTRTSNATHELVFILELKPLSYKSLYIKKSSKTKRNTNDYDFYTFWTKKTPIINNFDDAIIKNYNYDTKNDESSDKNEDFEDSTMKPYTDIVKIDDGDHKNDDLNGDGTTIKPYTDIVKIDDDKYTVTTQKPAVATKKSVTKKRTKQTAIYNDKIAENSDKFARNHDEIAKNGDDITEIGDDTPKYGDKNTVNDNEKIPLAPISKPSLENPSPEIFDDMNLDILKDGINDGSLTELEKFIRESRRKIEKERDRVKIEYPALNAEEMRMLSDEPKVVERFDDEVIWDNQIFKLHIDDTGLKSITINDKQLKLESNMLYYPGTAGHNEVPSDRASGAYILRPSQTNPIPLKPIKTERITSDIVKEIRTELTENGYMNLKMYKNLPFIDIEWVVGPIPITDDTGKEYILSHQSDIFNNGEFYTDLNGRQALKRRLNYRPEWNLTLVEPVAGNYYPITSYIYIENDDFRINVLPDRPEGGSSLREGEIELMLHRRLLFDDAFGVGEPLNETANNLGLVVRGNQRLTISKDCNFVRQNVINYYHRPQVLFSDTSMSLNDWLKLNNEFSFMGKFPYGLHLLTLEPWDDKLLVRIENYLEESRLSDVEIDLQSIFKNIRINNVKETMLSANIWAEDYKQWEWRKERDLGGKKERNTRIEGNKVKLSAKQIRNFIVDYDIV